MEIAYFGIVWFSSEANLIRRVQCLDVSVKTWEVVWPKCILHESGVNSLKSTRYSITSHALEELLDERTPTNLTVREKKFMLEYVLCLVDPNDA